MKATDFSKYQTLLRTREGLLGFLERTKTPGHLVIHVQRPFDPRTERAPDAPLMRSWELNYGDLFIRAPELIKTVLDHVVGEAQRQLSEVEAELTAAGIEFE